MQPRYKYISSDQVLTTTKFKLGIEGTTSCDAALRIYMQEGLGMLPSFDLTEYKTCVIPICDFKAKLPCGFIRFVEPNGIRIDNDSKYGCYYPRTVNNVMFKSDGRFACWGNIQLNNGFIYFDSDISATEVHLYYLSVLLDEQGRLKIPQSHSPVIQEYLLYQYYETRGDNRYLNHYSRWVRGVKQVKSRSVMPNVNEWEEIHLIMNSLL